MSVRISEEKKQAVKKIKDRLKSSSVILFSNYRGLTVEELTDFRGRLRGLGGEAKVLKNTFTRLALEELNIKLPDDVLSGPSLVVNSNGDAAKTSKMLVGFAAENEKFVIKGGILDSEVISPSTVLELAKLPSREELIAKVVGGIKAPITGLVSTVSGPIRGLVYVLNAIESQRKSSGGE